MRLLRYPRIPGTLTPEFKRFFPQLPGPEIFYALRKQLAGLAGRSELAMPPEPLVGAALRHYMACNHWWERVLEN